MLKKFFKKLFNTNPDDAISFKQGFELTDLPIVTLYQGDNKFNFLLDTGANMSIIDGNILNKLKHTVINKESEVFGLEGVSRKVSNCRLTFSYKGKEYEYEYLICDMKEVFGKIKKDSGVILHGVLGSKFFNEFKYVLDFDELIAYSKK